LATISQPSIEADGETVQCEPFVFWPLGAQSTRHLENWSIAIGWPYSIGISVSKNPALALACKKERRGIDHDNHEIYCHLNTELANTTQSRTFT
jgi:hypothetical protein